MAKNDTSRMRCNTCGVPESEIYFGVCDYCPGDTYCTMNEKDFIEKRVYDYAKKHNLLTHLKMDMFVPADIRQKMESPKVAGLAPKYFREAVSCDGLTFDKLEDFPVNTVLRVCRGNAKLKVGDLVWRGKGELNVIQDSKKFSAEESSSILKGAYFEETYYNVPNP